MFDCKIALVIMLCAIPGIASTLPRRFRKYKLTISARLSDEKSLLPVPVLATMKIVQPFFLVGGFAFSGAFLTPRVNLSSPFFSAVAHGGNFIESLPDPVPVLLLSLAGSVVFILMYYLIFQKWLDEESAMAMDELRNETGIVSRLLYGGIVEEIISRWGVMTLLVWLFNILPFLPESASKWIAIIITGILFGLNHFRSCLSAGCKNSAALYTTEIVLYLWTSLLFGCLYWRYGLLPVIISHIIFHLVWYPIDLAMLTRRRRATRKRSK